MSDWKNEILKNLNEPQQQAVQTTRGPLLILAGAGSGKTRTIIHRMAYLIHVENVPAYNLAAVTFTNKAAGEMRERLLNTAGPIGSECTVRTFHSLGLYLLRRNVQYLEYPENFSIWDDSDQQQALSQILEKFDGKYNKTQLRYFANTISGFKDKLVTPQVLPDEVDLDEYEFGDMLQEVYQLYEVKKQSSFAVDFADLISLPCHLFDKYPELLTRWQNRYPFWLIDEYQDTNLAQYRFVQHVASRDRNLCVVGDDDQAIYGWRGADVKNILDFSVDFKDAVVIKLEENYRSTKPILDIANAVIQNNFERMPKKLFTERDGGAIPSLMATADDVQEAQQVIAFIQNAAKTSSLSEIAVLYRTNSQSRLLEEACLNARIPYRVYGGMSFFARKEIKDVLAYFRLIVNGRDEAAFARVINTPSRGIGDKSVEKMFAVRTESGQGDFTELLMSPENPLSGKGRSASEKLGRDIGVLRKKVEAKMDLGFFLDELLDLTGLQKLYEEEDRLLQSGRMENIAELKNSLLAYQRQTESATLGDYLQQVSLITTTAPEDAETASVSLMTVHNAKGLEFETVIIAGFERNYFPHYLSERDGDISEERRLFYVAVTRAKTNLFFTRAERRMSQGFYEQSKVSPFLDEIPEELIRIQKTYGFSGSPSSSRVSILPSRPKPAFKAAFAETAKKPDFGSAVAPQSKGANYASGDKVQHMNFGKGRVLKVEGDGDSARIHIFFDDGKTRKFLLKFTELKRV
jgi:DNA helicase II / ATP-dependent DNA helicase PcrA